jgi:uncharacterized protein (DUF952 family)
VIAYHLVPAAAWDAAPLNRPFRPASLETEGFVHLTHRMPDLVDVANLLYRDERGPHLVLAIALERLSAPWRYDGDERYPHVYGPLDRAAITHVRPMDRDASGAFLGMDPAGGRGAQDEQGMPDPA